MIKVLLMNGYFLASVSLILSSVFMFGVLFYVYLVCKFKISRNLSVLSRVLECYKIISDER